jgi:hypothetical protein
LPFSRISAGPLGQSVLTTGQPQAKASTITLPNPSQAEERTKTEAPRHVSEGFLYEARKCHIIANAELMRERQQWSFRLGLVLFVLSAAEDHQAHLTHGHAHEQTLVSG